MSGIPDKSHSEQTTTCQSCVNDAIYFAENQCKRQRLPKFVIIKISRRFVSIGTKALLI